jgi:5'-nucleotidase
MLDILITNDDGIDAPGIGVMHEMLSEIGNVVAVAPQTNHSGIGRILSYGSSIGGVNEYETYQLEYDEHELGYAVSGTPCDCVIVGLNAIDIDPDIVISGCNPGANCGDIMSFRSGTVSAAVEAAHLGTSSMAVSVERQTQDPEYEDFARAAGITRDLIEFAFDTDLFADIDYLNVNVPQASRDEMAVEITTPLPFYEMAAESNGECFTVHNVRYQQLMDPSFEPGEGTDLWALDHGNLSLTPLRLPNTDCDPAHLTNFDVS